MKSAREDNVQLARLRGQMEQRSLCKCLLKHLMFRRFLMEGGREFQIDDPENTRPILKFFELYLLVDLMKSERVYSGISPQDTINIITALLYFSCFVNGRSLRLFSFCRLWD